ncbi:L-serine ammonia-lyase, iron-sulfur-dependent subunit beta [Gorillibacterium massiliense]|uniref:L-serine ammonia-lyase, iron-sulfur-dependent subunit beta n=1 Tax=Gorillibacterium massiliense TaxID=1280390 RepID=UPI0004AED2CB|nr:L-serine ammonia-lyase, iron-sulfur-dependent subunit beta [Gorillibacterium massiliense]
MRFKDVFSIIGPSMIGPSSSHTAGAARLGRIARRILGDAPEEAEIVFFGSFASTYSGHGTDLAIVAGLLDCDTDDPRIRDSLSIADSAGMKVDLRTSQKPAPHPNTAEILLKKGDRAVRITGCSIGGGNIEIINVNGFDVKFSADYPTLLIFHDDRRGMIADVTDVLRHADANIGYMEVDRKSRSGDALTVIETDQAIDAAFLTQIRGLPNVRRICIIDLTGKEEGK